MAAVKSSSRIHVAKNETLGKNPECPPPFLSDLSFLCNYVFWQFIGRRKGGNNRKRKERGELLECLKNLLLRIDALCGLSFSFSFFLNPTETKGDEFDEKVGWKNKLKS